MAAHGRAAAQLVHEKTNLDILGIRSPAHGFRLRLGSSACVCAKLTWTEMTVSGYDPLPRASVKLHGQSVACHEAGPGQ